MHELALSLGQILLAFWYDIFRSVRRWYDVILWERRFLMDLCSIRDIIVNWYSLAGAIYYTIAIFRLCNKHWWGFGRTTVRPFLFVSLSGDYQQHIVPVTKWIHHELIAYARLLLKVTCYNNIVVPSQVLGRSNRHFPCCPRHTVPHRLRSHRELAACILCFDKIHTTQKRPQAAFVPSAVLYLDCS